MCTKKELFSRMTKCISLFVIFNFLALGEAFASSYQLSCGQPRSSKIHIFPDLKKVAVLKSSILHGAELIDLKVTSFEEGFCKFCYTINTELSNGTALTISTHSIRGVILATFHKRHVSGLEEIEKDINCIYL